MTTDQLNSLVGKGQDRLPLTASRELMGGLLVLSRAYHYARDVGADRWEFAVEFQQFYDIRFSNSQLRWLVAKGYAEHGQETSAFGDTRRSFRPTDGLTFSTTSALALTESGDAFASQFSGPAHRSRQTVDCCAGLSYKRRQSPGVILARHSRVSQTKDNNIGGGSWQKQRTSHRLPVANINR